MYVKRDLRNYFVRNTTNLKKICSTIFALGGRYQNMQNKKEMEEKSGKRHQNVHIPPPPCHVVVCDGNDQHTWPGSVVTRRYAL